MIESEEIEQVYEFVKHIEGIKLTNAFEVDEEFEEDFELICGESEKGKFWLWDNEQYVFAVEYPDGKRTHWHPFEAEDAAVEVEKFMGESNRDFNNLYSAYYDCGMLFPHNEEFSCPEEDSRVFVISEKKEKDYTKKFWNLKALEKCKDYVCYGKYVSEQRYYFLSVIDKIEDFASDIHKALANNEEKVFLFYDDRITYNKVKNILSKLKEGSR